MENHQVIHSAILKSQLGAELNAQELDLLITYNKIFEFENGDVILKQGKEAPGIFILISGKARVITKTLGDTSTELEILEPGDSFGESSYIEGIPNTTSIIAATEECKCLFLTKTYLKLITEIYPETKYKLFNAISRHICHHLSAMHAKIISYMTNSDLPTQSMFTEFYHSFTKPTETTFAEQHIDINQLSNQSYFTQFTDDELKLLFERTKLIHCPKHCTLIHHDEKDNACYIIIQGAVLSGIMHEQKFAKLSVIGPLTLFANAACIAKEAQHFTITFSTCERALLLKFTQEELDEFKKSYPLLWYKIYNLICRSLIELEKSVNKLDVRLNIEKYNR